LKRKFEPELVILYCRNCVAKEVSLSGRQKGPGFGLKFAAMPCASKLEMPHLLKILEAGADGILVVGCPDPECSFGDGSFRANQRVSYLQRRLAEIGVGEERLAMLRGKDLSAAEILEMAAGRVKTLIELGPNPSKGEES